jgi:hypothetical protein
MPTHSVRGKSWVLLREDGIDSIGGIQGDYEFIEFERGRLQDLALGLMAVFDFTVTRLRPI